MKINAVLDIIKEIKRNYGDADICEISYKELDDLSIIIFDGQTNRTIKLYPIK